MSDIPVGSPPAPPGRHAAPGGWYPDPLDPRRERYWDGWQWSRNLRDAAPPPGSWSAASSPTDQASGGYPPAQAPPDAYPPGSFPQGQPGAGGYSPDGYPPQPYGQPGGYPADPRAAGHAGYGQQPYGGAPGYAQLPYGGGAAGLRVAQTADGVPLASWWWRVLAVVVDSFIVGLIAAIPSAPIYSRVYEQFAALMRETVRAAEAGQPAPPIPSPTTLVPTTDQLALTLIGLIVALAYHLLFVRWKAATPGKLLCHLRIVPVDQGRNQARLPWSTVLIRVAIWVLPRAISYLLIFRLVDVLFPLWHPKRQALHDLAARTQVVRLR